MPSDVQAHAFEPMQPVLEWTIKIAREMNFPSIQASSVKGTSIVDPGFVPPTRVDNITD